MVLNFILYSSSSSATSKQASEWINANPVEPSANQTLYNPINYQTALIHMLPVRCSSLICVDVHVIVKQQLNSNNSSTFKQEPVILTRGLTNDVVMRWAAAM